MPVNIRFKNSINNVNPGLITPKVAPLRRADWFFEERQWTTKSASCCELHYRKLGDCNVVMVPADDEMIPSGVGGVAS